MIGGAPAKLDELTVNGEASDAQDVVNREAVFQAVHAAGVFSDIAADGTGDLGRGVGRVVKAVGGSRLGDFQIADARLQAGDAGVRVDLEHLVQFCQRQQHAGLVGSGAAG